MIIKIEQHAVFVDGKQYVSANETRPKPIPADSWEALMHAERALYRGTGTGHGYTDTMQNDGDALLSEVWNHTYICMEGIGDFDGLPQHVRDAQCARRVARALALMAFGPEFLLA